MMTDERLRRYDTKERDRSSPATPRRRTTMDAKRRAYVETMMEVAEDFSDGAFLGFMEECGIDLDELVELSTPREEDTGHPKEAEND